MIAKPTTRPCWRYREHSTASFTLNKSTFENGKVQTNFWIRLNLELFKVVSMFDTFFLQCRTTEDLTNGGSVFFSGGNVHGKRVAFDYCSALGGATGASRTEMH
jgi:hypothetical protein